MRFAFSHEFFWPRFFLSLHREREREKWREKARYSSLERKTNFEGKWEIWIIKNIILLRIMCSVFWAFEKGKEGNKVVKERVWISSWNQMGYREDCCKKLGNVFNESVRALESFEVRQSWGCFEIRAIIARDDVEKQRWWERKEKGRGKREEEEKDEFADMAIRHTDEEGVRAVYFFLPSCYHHHPSHHHPHHLK